MELSKLLNPYLSVIPDETPIKSANLELFKRLVGNAPLISEDAKNRAKSVSSSVKENEELEAEPEYSYDDAWAALSSAESTSDYTKIPESWSNYSNLISDSVKYRAKKARDFFRKRLSLTRELASGIVGVLVSETNMDPSSYNKHEKGTKSYYGAGIGSWTFSDTKKRIKGLLENISGEKKGEIENYTLDELLEAYALDLENHPEILSLLKKTSTVDDAADVVTRGVENGGMSGKLVSKEWFNKGYRWIKGKDSSGKEYNNHYQAAMYNVDPKYAIGRAISSRLIYSLT